VLLETTLEGLEEAVQEGLSAMAALQGMRGYRETFLLRKLYLSQAPGAPIPIERRRKALTPVMVDMQPVFDFRSGNVRSGVPFVTRDRATVFYDPFDARSQANANILVTGTSGAGKSVAVQMILSGYEIMAECHGHPPPRVFIIDNGASYKRYMDLRPHDARYVAFSFAEPPGCDVFAFDPATEDREEHVGRLQWLLVDLLRLDPDREADFQEKNAAIEHALLQLYADGADPWNRTFSGLSAHLGTSDAGRTLAVRLRSFVDGKFARLFQGNPRLAVRDEVRAVCYDFRLLAEHPDLALIALRLVIYEIRRTAARSHRASGRRSRSFLVLDESWALLDSGTGGAMTTMAAPFIAASVRMGRKEGLSTIALSQQVEDFALSGYGAAILGNSATKLVGRPGKEGVEGIRKHLQLSDRQVEQVRRLVCSDRFHEFLLTQGDVTNIIRVALDPLSRWIFTTSPTDRDRIYERARHRPDLDLLGVLRSLAVENGGQR
jgi:type IV secretory pathway VirB4 component